MNKKLSPLEALKRIRQETCPATYNQDFDKEECCDIIETALKRLEQLEEEKQSFDRVIEKKIKAFEIIKEKRVDIVPLLEYHNAEEYNKWVWTRSHYTYPPSEITQEEYDLLKEVLL